MANTGFGPSRFGLAAAPALSGAPSETAAMATPSADDPDGRLLHPGNPLLAFGVIGAVVFGLMAFSTSVRVGHTKAGISIGDTK